MKSIILFALTCTACAGMGEQTRHAFTIRSPTPTFQVSLADHTQEHEDNLQQAINSSVMDQEQMDRLEERWTYNVPSKTINTPKFHRESCIYDVDTDTWMCY